MQCLEDFYVCRWYVMLKTVDTVELQSLRQNLSVCYRWLLYSSITLTENMEKKARNLLHSALCQ